MAELITSLDEFPDRLRGGALAVGNFDGVHRGHAELIEKLTAKAASVDGPAVVLTFDPPPVAILVPDRPPTPPLTTIQRRAQLLGRLGVDALIAYPTDRSLLELSAEEFFHQKVLGLIGPKWMVEGPNFHFGKDRQGDTEMLTQLCHANDMELVVVEPCMAAADMISSTRIRGLLSEGQVAQANDLLTSRYQIQGVVSKGSQRGRQIGFPTANLTAISSLLPAHGVYSGLVERDDRCIPAAIHIGPNPTFGERQSKVEIHMIDWEGDLYGEQLSVELIGRVRGVVQFDSVESLTRQLEKDIQACRETAQLACQDRGR